MLEDVHELDRRLGDVPGAESAIAADRVQAWQELGDAVRLYDEVRVAQRDLTALQFGGDADATWQAT